MSQSYGFCSTHFVDRNSYVVHSIETVSVPQSVISKNNFTTGSRKNLFGIKPNANK